MVYEGEILAIKTDVLFKEKSFTGFVTLDEHDLTKTILDNAVFVPRTEELENDASWQQPIPYLWIVNPSTKKVFLYKRAKSGDEGRLHNKYSGGVGGHIDKETELGKENPLMSAMVRELKEETTMDNYPEPKIVGYLNLNGGVNEYHVGVVGLAETNEEVKPAIDIAECEFYTIEEAEALFKDEDNVIEEWTTASWPFVRDYLNKL